MTMTRDTDPSVDVSSHFHFRLLSLSYLICQLDVLLEGPDGRVGQLDEDDALFCTVFTVGRRCRRCRR